MREKLGYDVPALDSTIFLFVFVKDISISTSMDWLLNIPIFDLLSRVTYNQAAFRSSWAFVQRLPSHQQLWIKLTQELIIRNWPIFRRTKGHPHDQRAYDCVLKDIQCDADLSIVDADRWTFGSTFKSRRTMTNGTLKDIGNCICSGFLFATVITASFWLAKSSYFNDAPNIFKMAGVLSKSDG